MSVVVLGMEMPKVCITEGGWYHSCPMDRTWCAQRFAPKGLTNVQIFESQECKIPDWCPLRPLPEKHGALIDRDALLKQKGGCYDHDGHLLYAVGTGNILCAPTIVEAEGD